MELLRTTQYIIRHVETLDELIHIERMQVEVWGIHNPVELVPKDILLIVQKNGGLVLGAFDFNGKMIGFLFGFIGQTLQGHFKHCSHMMGVLAEYRHLGIGEQLKRVQREVIQQQGMDLITWTVNPLEGVNASLNFGKLGVICRTFLPNFYGEMEDELNKGLPSDRFQVEWWINSERVTQRLAGVRDQRSTSDWLEAGAKLVNRVRSDGKVEFETDLNGQNALLIEMPVSIQQIKMSSINLAREWLELSRQFFVSAFENDFVVTEFISETKDGQRRNYYLLIHAPANITK